MCLLRMDSETISHHGTSKQRRQDLNRGVEQLKKAIQLSPEDSKKLSQLQTLHYACIYMRKQKLITNLNETSKTLHNSSLNLLTNSFTQAAI